MYSVAVTHLWGKERVPSQFLGYPLNLLAVSSADTKLLIRTLLTDYIDSAAGVVNPTNDRNNIHPCVHVVFVHRLHDFPAHFCRSCSHFTVDMSTIFVSGFRRHLAIFLPLYLPILFLLSAGAGYKSL